jgi:hypothetical protein
MIEMHEDGGYTVSGTEDIEVYRLLTLRAALSLEARTGLRPTSRGRSAKVLANEAMGTKFRDKEKTYEAFDAWLVARYPGRVEHKPLR